MVLGQKSEWTKVRSNENLDFCPPAQETKNVLPELTQETEIKLPELAQETEKALPELGQE